MSLGRLIRRLRGDRPLKAITRRPADVSAWERDRSAPTRAQCAELAEQLVGATRAEVSSALAIVRIPEPPNSSRADAVALVAAELWALAGPARLRRLDPDLYELLFDTRAGGAVMSYSHREPWDDVVINLPGGVAYGDDLMDDLEDLIVGANHAPDAARVVVDALRSCAALIRARFERTRRITSAQAKRRGLVEVPTEPVLPSPRKPRTR